MNPVEETIEAYLVENFFVDFGSDVTRDSNLFKLGLVDSFGYIELISFLEREFGVKLSDDELVSPLLSSLAAMTALVMDKTHEVRLST